MSRALPGSRTPALHLLPAGMRDLLPLEARRRRTLARMVLDHFALHGYELVMPPAFEFTEVLERGLGTLDPRDLLRFVEPESGDVAALRPDMTPQIARMVSTRLSDEPAPIRLCYEGTIVRRRQRHARRHRQIAQAGVELYGAPSLDGDREVLSLAASVARAAGLGAFVLDVGHANIARALLESTPDDVRNDLTAALVYKDAARVDDIVSTSGNSIAGPIGDALRTLPHLCGGGADDVMAKRVLAEARRVLGATPALAPLAELEQLWNVVHTGGTSHDALAEVLRIDVGEVRGFAYYTGVIFHLLASGPGEAIAAGGRYDDLLGRFGMPMPATGFALNLDALGWALRTAGVEEAPTRRVLVALGSDGDAVVRALRDLGVPAVAHTAIADPLAYARAWRFTHLVTRSGPLLEALRLSAEPQAIALPIGASAEHIARTMASS